MMSRLSIDCHGLGNGGRYAHDPSVSTRPPFRFRAERKPGQILSVNDLGHRNAWPYGSLYCSFVLLVTYTLQVFLQ